MNHFDVRTITLAEARAFVAAHHYAKNTPSVTRVCYGLYVGDRLMGVATWGYGVRPRHTIERWFPGLSTADYLELGRLCLLDELPRNSESRFLSLICARIKRDYPALKLLLSWADGLRGKVGYVYQACSWYYGGFRESDFYATAAGEVVHPRLLISQLGTRKKAVTEAIGLLHYYGRQFMYAKPLCHPKEAARLLANSPYTWSQNYPKAGDLRFSVAQPGAAGQR